MNDFVDDPLGLDPFSPPRYRDPRWFIPAHAAGSSLTASLSGRQIPSAQRVPIPAPRELFPTWRRAQLEVDRLAGEAALAPRVTGEKPGLRADLPPADLVAACMNEAARDLASNEHGATPWHA